MAGYKEFSLLHTNFLGILLHNFLTSEAFILLILYRKLLHLLVYYFIFHFSHISFLSQVTTLNLHYRKNSSALKAFCLCHVDKRVLILNKTFSMLNLHNQTSISTKLPNTYSSKILYVTRNDPTQIGYISSYRTRGPCFKTSCGYGWGQLHLR